MIAAGTMISAGTMIAADTVRPLIRCFCITFGVLFLNACASFTSTEVPLSYVGNVKLGDIQSTGDGVDIPVSFKGGNLNSVPALMFRDIKSELKGKYIYLTVRVYKHGKMGKPGDYMIHIKHIEPGSFYVYYRNPNGVIQALKRITIPEKGKTIGI